MRFCEEVVWRDSFDRVLHEWRRTVQQLFLMFDKELRRSGPFLAFQRVVDSLLPLTQHLVLPCNLSMQPLFCFSAFDLKKLFPYKVSKKGMELVSIQFQSPD